MIQFDLNGYRALITGSTQGIGLAIASCLAEHGASVIIHGGTGREKCLKAAETIRGAKEIAVQDLSEHDCAQKLHATTGDVDILVINASVQFRCSWESISMEEFDRQVDINFRATLSLIQQYVPAMLKKGWGRVVIVGSVQEYKPNKDMAVYAACKDAGVSLVKNFARQFASQGVTVNSLCPGVIRTPRCEDAINNPPYWEQVIRGIPVGYAGEPEDCAAAALLLCSEESRYITGSEIIVDGGMHL